MPQHLGPFSRRVPRARLALWKSSSSRILAASLALAACIAATTPPAHAQRPVAPHLRRPAKPQLEGSDGTSTGIASFLGNLTVIAGNSNAILMGRLPDCSLTLWNVTDSLSSSSYTYTTTTTPHYEQTLHTEAGLKTTPDVFTGGCNAPVVNISTRPAVFAGQTTSGIYVGAIVGTLPTMNQGVYIVNGSTTSNATVSTFNFSSAAAVTAADLNGDGNGDLIFVNNNQATSASVTVMMGNADGTFQNGVTYPIAGNYSAAAVAADVNGDGKPDIVAVSADQQISVLLNKGDGTFNAAMSFAAPALPGHSSAAQTPINSLITASLRGNGKVDIICSNGLVLLGDGAGNFTPNATPAFSYVQDTYTSFGPTLDTGDFNGDGKADIVVDSGSKVSVLLGNGDGTFTDGSSYATINSSGFVRASDIDGDGNSDIYVGTSDGPLYGGDSDQPAMAYALMGNGDGTFVGAPTVNGGGAYNGKNLVDLNGDKLADLITLNNAQNTLNIELGDGKGNFTPSTTDVVTIPSSLSLEGTAIGTAQAQISDFALGDLNGDGKPDLAFVVTGLTFNNGAAQYGSPVFFTALNNGDGTFSAPVVHQFSTLVPQGANNQTPSFSGVEIGNFVNNGHGDVLFSFMTPGAISAGAALNEGFAVYPGDGTGNFGAPQITYTYQNATTSAALAPPLVAAVADLNNDKSLDLLAVVPTGVASGMLQTSLEEFRGNGDGTFTAGTTINCAPNPAMPNPPATGGASIVLTDLNKDGNPDLACLGETTAGQGELAIATGNGDGTFFSPTTLNIAGGDTARTAQIAAADFDGDGNVDLALIDPDAYSGVFYGTGTGTFTYVNSNGTAVPKDLINIFSQSSSGFGAVFADLNNDGKPDILYSNTIYLNQYGSTATFPGSNTLLKASVTTATAGASITFTAAVNGQSGTTGTPTGTVVFMDGPTQLATVTLAAGQAAYTTTGLAAGVHDITAVYSGDSNFSSSTSNVVTITINLATPVDTSTSLAASATSALVGASITFTAKVTPASGTLIPAGTVSFIDGGSTIGVEDLDATGSASLIASGLMAGVHSITAHYSGSGSFNPSSSSAVSVTITLPPQDFTFTISASSGAVTTASPTNTATLTVTPVNNFSAAVSFACSGLPADVTCSFYPVTLTPGDGQPATTAVTFTESTTKTSLLDRGGDNGEKLLYAGFGLGGMLLLFGGRRRRRLVRTLGVFVAALPLAWIISCGSKTGNHQLQNSTVTITATSTVTSGTLTHSVTYTLTSN